MAAPFAALEARINAAVIAHLANATADFGGGVVADVEFGAPYESALGVVAGTMPAMRARTVDVAGIAAGAAVTVSGVGYTVTGLEPDGAGMTLLRLQES